MRTNHRKKLVLFFQLGIIAILSIATFFVSSETLHQQNTKGRAQTANCNVTANELAMTASEQKLLNLINAYRQQNGAPVLVSQPQLKKAAEWLSNHMATGGPFSHTDGLGRAYSKRLTDCGYTGRTTSENIASNQDNDSAAKTFDQWKNSPGHNTNMLNSNYKQIGIAEFVSQNGKHYWTFDAGAGGAGGTVPTAKPQPTAVPPTRVPTAVPPTQVPPTTTPSGGTNPPADPSSPVQPTKPQEEPTPTFTCLGACVTEGPSPNDPGTDPNDPPVGIPSPGTPGNGGGSGGQTKDQNLITLILILIIQIIRELFGR